MTLRAARRAARIAFHRAAHLDTLASVPDHAPEDCPPQAEVLVLDTLDIQPYRLDAIMEAVAPVLRRHAIQEHARRYGRRSLQLTPAEVHALRRAIEDRTIGLEGDRGRSALQQRQALSRVVGKLAGLES